MTETKMLLEWQFTPPNYFEEEVSLQRPDYTLKIANGKVECELPTAVYESNPDVKDQIHRMVEDRFLGAQLVTHQPFDLSKPSVTRVNPDGSNHYFVEMHAAVVVSGTADVRVTDAQGNVLSDSRQERIDYRRRLGDEVEKYRNQDVALSAAMASYSESVRDPNNELVHLYEVRDAFAKRFGGEDRARAALSISKQQWSRLGDLCNNQPLKQGRHRGKDLGALRDATSAEIFEAREIARQMIESYLLFLHSTAP